MEALVIIQQFLLHSEAHPPLIYQLLRIRKIKQSRVSSEQAHRCAVPLDLDCAVTIDGDRIEKDLIGDSRIVRLILPQRNKGIITSVEYSSGYINERYVTRMQILSRKI